MRLSSLLDKLLESRVLRRAALLVGLVGGAATIFSRIFPDSLIPQWIILLAFWGVAAYLLLYLIELSMRLLAPKTEYIYRYSAQRYGIGYGDLKASCSILIGEPPVAVRHVVVEAYSTLEILDTFLLVPEAVLTPRPGEKADINLVEVRSLTRETDVSMVSVSKNAGRVSALLRITPPLKPGQKLTYEMTELLPSTLYAIEESDLQRRRVSYDYWGWSISRPTRKLSLSVHFPEDHYPVDYGIEVRYASAAPGMPAETRQFAEEHRLRPVSLKGDEGGHYSLIINVDYPMVGLIYILRWKRLERITSSGETGAESTEAPALTQEPTSAQQS